jgi:hypothetical protein
MQGSNRGRDTVYPDRFIYVITKQPQGQSQSKHEQREGQSEHIHTKGDKTWQLVSFTQQ